ncbi:spermidine synthase [Coccinella septempunctata]|uniref:spermidine synthase n=1 Tax=Coccinella septempunctata TaxID=41139 RepID=UPI001D094932|nr:spermidine synthase [Coccinella septempunctata]
MVKYCCAPGCLNYWGQNKNITFHRFPHKRPDILEKWIQATKMKNFEANLFAMICSDHFTVDCYTENNLHRRILKKEAIPTIFKHFSDNVKTAEEAKPNEAEPSSSDTNEKSVSEQMENHANDPVVQSNHITESAEKMDCLESASGQIQDGWFREINDMWPGQHLALKVDKVLSCEKSEYQEIMVLQTSNHGKALILDGIIQCTENDEFAYQEMISFLPLCAHPNPERVLIVGGGDGGVAREVTKHPLVKEIVQVEIDQKVIDVCKKHLPSMSKGFDSEKLNLQVCDGFEYMRTHKNEFDVIITDSSDPIGPATALFSESYFLLLKEALRPGGIICSQGGTIWAGIEMVKSTFEHCRKHFKVVRYPIASVPTYPTGQIGFFLAALDETNDLSVPKLNFTQDELDKYELKYYNSEIHRSCFVLPNFAKKVLYG